MTPELLRIVDRRLEATGALEQSWSLLVIGACEGAETLDGILGGDKPAARAARARTQAATEPAPTAGAYLDSITVEGFRGVGPKRTLELTPTAGLTLVVGRNGSGKSSFAEGVEILLTGTNSRWAKRSKIWQEGWRNLHHTARTAVEATFAIDGQKGDTFVTRNWADGAGPDDSTATVRLPDKSKHDLSTLGWTSAVETFRPFLSYNELGATFDAGPTEFHDRLSRILGLGDIDEALQLLKRARLDRTGIVDDAKQRLSTLLDQLETVDDPRATAALKALKGRTWDLDAAERTLDATPGGTTTAEETQPPSRPREPPGARPSRGPPARRRPRIDRRARARRRKHARRRGARPDRDPPRRGSPFRHARRRRLPGLRQEARAPAVLARPNRWTRSPN